MTLRFGGERCFGGLFFVLFGGDLPFQHVFSFF